jgi:hypothetical protein
MFIVELILYSPRRIDCVAERACYIGCSVDVREIMTPYLVQLSDSNFESDVMLMVSDRRSWPRLNSTLFVCTI